MGKLSCTDWVVSLHPIRLTFHYMTALWQPTFQPSLPALWCQFSPFVPRNIFHFKEFFFRFPQSERLEQTREKGLQKISCPSGLPPTENLLKDSQVLRLSSGFLLRRIIFEAQQIEVPHKRFLCVLFLMEFHRRPDTVVSLYMYWLRKQHNNSAFLCLLFITLFCFTFTKRLLSHTIEKN